MYCIVLYCIVLYCIVLYCIVLYCIVLYCIVLYCIVLYCIVCMYVCMYVSECDTRDCHINSNMSGYLIEHLGSGRPRYEVVAGRCSAITRHSAAGPGKKDNPSSKVGGTSGERHL